jgi:beta-lactam-binding protein with PASTA domain
MTAYTPEDAVLPELVGLTVRQAVSELSAAGLQAGKLKFVEDPYKNNVIEQTCKGKTVYAGQQIERGSMIDLLVGLGDGSGRSVVPFVLGRTSDRARRDILSASLNVGREHFGGVKNRSTAVVVRQDPDYTGVSKYTYGTSVELWYRDADDVDVDKMVREFQVDSSKIVESEVYDDGRPTPEEIEEMDEQIW